MVNNTESGVSKLPQIDLAYDLGKGYDAISELMRAMILRTIEDLKNEGELREGALAYMYAEDDDDDEYILSFKSICQFLGFDPEVTRNYIIQAVLKEGRKISTRRRAA